MKRVFASTVLAMFCAAALAAQTPAGDQKKAGQAAKSDEKTVTITGCLRAGETPNSFVLANVKDESASKTTPSTTAAPPSAAPSTGSAMAAGDIKLIGAPASLDLTKHIGHTVSVTGSWSPVGKSQATGTTGTAGAAGSSAASARSFNVKSMTHQSETCK